MQIRNLSGTPLSLIVDCLVQSFADYFVPMTPDVNYWAARFKANRVDFNYSYGMFDENQLIGFIIIAIDEYEGQLNAYNGGTGVLPAYRNQKVVDQLYKFALPEFRKRGVEKCTLEVIEQNLRAIRVYERIGFAKSKFYRCYKGSLTTSGDAADLITIPFEEINQYELQQFQMPSWDHTAKSVLEAGDTYQSFADSEDGYQNGFCVLNPANGFIAQLGLFHPTASWRSILESIGGKYPQVKINNIDNRRTSLVEALSESGLENHINQYEMEMAI